MVTIECVIDIYFNLLFTDFNLDVNACTIIEETEQFFLLQEMTSTNFPNRAESTLTSFPPPDRGDANFPYRAWKERDVSKPKQSKFNVYARQGRNVQ